ncbi:biotin carboxylase N-terminal domain-containing protein [Nesterenkonia halophila]
MRRLLIANRGEIAVRIIRAAAEQGLETVAVHVDQDADSLAVALADVAVPLAGTTATETYLDQQKILEAAQSTGADAVHPGYGFLSENADFARAVTAAGLIWVGPSPETIERLGDKVAARELAASVDAPLAPGTDGPVAGPQAVRDFVAEHGLPVVIKAAHGGGGRGMRVVRDLDAVEEAWASAVREAEGAFGRGECFVERFLDRPRHVEAQVIADAHGHVAVVGLRDCSLQRRGQKLVEEAPAPFLPAGVEERIRASAAAICAAAGYVGAGTVEYLLSDADDAGSQPLVSFLEVNTRLQVEHPVTEETSGVDLVVEQLRVAAGEPLSLPEDPGPRGHAIEFRLNAEDPALGFLPTPGLVERFDPPTGPGVRLDAGVRAGDEIPAAFDSMIGKLIITGPDRETALRRARLALAEMRIEGVPSVLPFHRAVLEAPAFRAADGAGGFTVHTRWIEEEFDAALAESEHLAAALRHREQQMLRSTVELDGRTVELGLPAALLRRLGGGPAGGTGGAAADADRSGAEDGAVTTPVGGSLVRWAADDGAVVAAGDALAVVEAMKMEHTVTAPQTGTLKRAALEPGEMLETGQRLGTVR